MTEYFKFYLEQLIADYNDKARGMKRNRLLCTDRIFEEAKARLNGAVTAAKMLGVDVKITYTEPTYYYSEIIINN